MMLLNLAVKSQGFDFWIDPIQSLRGLINKSQQMNLQVSELTAQIWLPLPAMWLSPKLSCELSD